MSSHKMTVAGWALVGDRPPGGVVVLLDGRLAAGAATGLPRPDVAAEAGPAAVGAGFSCVVDLRSVGGADERRSRRRATLEVVAHLDDGTLSGVIARSTVKLRGRALEPHGAGRLEGHVDLPEPGTRADGGTLCVAGWAAYEGKPVVDVVVQVGEHDFVRATPTVRHDVAVEKDNPLLERSGFVADVDLGRVRGVAGRELEIHVVALVDASTGDALPDPELMRLGTVAVAVGGPPSADTVASHSITPPADRLEPRAAAVPAAPPAGSAAAAPLASPVPSAPAPRPPGVLQEAAEHAGIGLPVPEGARHRGLKRLVARIGRPFLHRQVAYNRTVLSVLEELNRAVGAMQADMGALRASSAAEAERLRRDLDARAADLGDDLERTADELWAHAGRSPDASERLREEVHALREQLDLSQRQVFERHHAAQGALRSELVELGLTLGELRTDVESRLGDLFADAGRQRADAHVRQAQVELFLNEVRRSLPEPADARRLAELPTAVANAYETFTDAFRGPPELITRRLADYLEDVLALDLRGPVVDLGSGRGEWLELLRKAGVDAYGVELSERLVALCTERGLDARTGDALAHLAHLPAGSLSAVTAFHLAEHLPLEHLIELLDRSLRALRPGGLLILETPNPDNLVVGASTFYLDPTHLRPLNPDLAKLLVESRGFVDVEVRFKHPDPGLAAPAAGAPWANDLQPLIDALNSRLYGARDFAIVARRLA